MCSKWAPRRCRHIWIRRAKFSMTLPHSSLGIALIAAFRSGIVWVLLPYTLSLRYPTDKNLGGSSPVNAANTAGHTCSWSVGQGNAAVAMPMILLRSWGWHHPAGTTGGPWRPFSVDHVLSRTCQAPGHIARCWLAQIARCRPRTRMVQWCHVRRWQPRQCTSQSAMAFADSAQGVCYPRRCCSHSSRDLTTENVPRSKTRHCQESPAQRQSCHKTTGTCKNILLSSPWHLEGRIW